MKIVVLDGYTENPGDLSWKALGELGELIVYDRTPQAAVAERIGDAEAVYTNKALLTRETLENCDNLKFIGVLATGYNVVDIQAAQERGIVVSNIPTYGTMAVAQYTMALILELCHHVGEHSACVHRGDWGKNPDWCFWNYPLIELAGKKLGIVGYGRIGQTVADMAKVFGMDILVYDQMKKKTDGVRQVELDILLEESDFITLHCPLLPSNKEMINRESIAKMKDGVFLINDARGPLVNEMDLREALLSGKVAGAALDVVSEEPITSENPLLGLKNVIITPHIAWAPKESRQRLMDIAVENLRMYLQGTPVNVVN